MSTMSPEQLYESDFYAWTQQQAKELRRFARTRPNASLDLAHIAEEIRDLGKSELDAVVSLSRQIIQHFLLIEYSPAVEPRQHWADEIDEFRARMRRKLSPTIRRRLKRELDDVYGEARHNVTRKMRRSGEEQATEALPRKRPYTIDQIRGDWEPGEPARGAR